MCVLSQQVTGNGCIGFDNRKGIHLKTTQKVHKSVLYKERSVLVFV